MTGDERQHLRRCVERIAAASKVLADDTVADAVRVLAADPFTNDHPDSFLGQLIGWLESAVRQKGTDR